MQAYPEVLLPRKVYKLKIQLPLSELDRFYLVRRSLVKQEDTTNDLGTVRSQAFIHPGKEHLFFSQSCNLLGIFLREHLLYVLAKEDGRRYWVDKDAELSSNNINYSVEPDFCALYLKVEAIHNYTPFPFQKRQNKKILYFDGTCKVMHMPLVANYWHFEIHVFEQNGERIRPNESSWKKEAAWHFLESYLKIHLTINEVDVDLDESLYMESA